MYGLWLFAQTSDRPDPLRSPEVIWGTAALAAALLFGAFAVWIVDRWRKQANARSDALAELTDFRGMYERGELTEDEYVKLRDKVAKRAKAPPPSLPATGATPIPPAPPEQPSGGK